MVKVREEEEMGVKVEYSEVVVESNERIAVKSQGSNF